MPLSTAVTARRAKRQRAGGVIVATALLCALVLFAENIIPITSRANAATTRARDLKALPSPKASSAKPETPNGDTADAPPSTSQPARPSRQPTFDPSTSTADDAETTPTEKLYRNRDGSRTVMLSSSPVRYRGNDGAWHDV